MVYQVGDMAGPYRILGILGRGGMGHVFKVEHTITKRVEAMKMLLAGHTAQPELAQRFLREIQIQASLDHPNIARVHNAMVVGDDLMMVMEFVEGESLEALLEVGPLPWRRAVDYARQALDALGYAHARDITHRDIKPANMIVTPGGILKLTDFGLAKLRSEDTGFTKSGTVMGSVHYMSPEQVKGVPDLDARTDIYSLGTTIYESITGLKAASGDSAFDIMSAHLTRPPVPLIEHDLAVPQGLSDVVEKALSRRREERFATAEEFRQALTLLDSEWEPAPGQRRSRTGVLVGAGAAVVALALTAVVWTRRGAVAPETPVAKTSAPETPAAEPTTAEKTPQAVRETPLPKKTVAPASLPKQDVGQAPSSAKIGVLAPAPGAAVAPAPPSDKTSAAPAPRGTPATLPAGTTLHVRTTLTLSTASHKAGETFLALLEEPLQAGDRLVAAKGATVEGRIEEAETGGRVRGRAQLAVSLTALHVGGHVLAISTEPVAVEGETSKVRVVRRAPAAVLKANSVLTFRMLRPLTLP